MGKGSGILRRLLARIDENTPEAWVVPKYDNPQWHPISKISHVERPARLIQPRSFDATNMPPEKPFSIESLQGEIISPAYGDRTVAGKYISGFDEVEFPDPIRMRGGRGFMREPTHGLWASEKNAMKTKAGQLQRLVDEGETPSLIYVAMGAQSADFSREMSRAVMQQFRPSKISDAAAKAFDDRMVALGVKGWPGTKSGKVEEALEGMKGSERWVIWQAMDKAMFKDAGFPDIGSTRVAITDPALLNVRPFSSGMAVGRPNPKVYGPGESDFTTHPSYSHQIGGKYMGILGDIPGSIMWRDWFRGRRAEGAPVGSDAKSFIGSNVTQRVDQQLVDEIEAWIAGTK
jgi:hypothetical protein